jgi:phage gp29-like protein
LGQKHSSVLKSLKPLLKSARFTKEKQNDINKIEQQLEAQKQVHASLGKLPAQLSHVFKSAETGSEVAQLTDFLINKISEHYLEESPERKVA